MPRFLYTNAIYNIEDNSPATYFRGLDSNEKRFDIRTTGFDPCFFVKDSDLNRDELLSTGKVKSISKFPSVSRSILGNPVSLVKVNVPTDVSDRWSRNPRGLVNVKMADCQTFQSDIKFEQNVMIWNGIFSGIEVPSPKFTYYDIPSYDIKELKPYDENDIEPTIDYVDIETWWFPGDRKEDIDKALKPVTAFTSKINKEKGFFTRIYHPEKEPKQDKINDVLNGLKGIEYPWEIKFHITEKDLLQDFVDSIVKSDPDIITGWNIDYDICQIINRCRKNGVDSSIMSPYSNFIPDAVKIDGKEPLIKGRTIMDEKNTYMKHTMFDGMLRSYRLEFVLQHEFKAGKVKYSGTTGQLLQRDPFTFARYNAIDVEACEMLDKVKELFKYKEYVRRQLGVQVHYANSMDVALHSLFVRRSMSKGMAFLNRNYDNPKFKGANVFDASVGMFDSCVDMDFKTLYPYIIISFNLSPETIIDDPEHYTTSYMDTCIRTPNGLVLHPASAKKGFIPEICEEFIAKRDEAKQKALEYREKFGKNDPRTKGAEQAQKYEKGKTNAVYGMMSKYDIRIAEAITAIEREIIQHASDLAESIDLRIALEARMKK